MKDSIAKRVSESAPRDYSPDGDRAIVQDRAPAAEADVALLVDWENLKWGLREHFRAAPNITSLIAASRAHGRLVIARAYADWTQPQLAIDAPNLYRAGIEPVYAQGRYKADGSPFKNSADVRLAVDTVALCSQLPHVGVYVLVTGDGDLVHPINHVRLQGHRVVVIAVSATMSGLLEATADSVLLYERDVEPLEPVHIAPPERSRPVAEALEKLKRWLPFVLSGTRAKQSFTSLQEALLSRVGFNVRDYGVSFKELMLMAAKQGLVEISTEGSMDFAVIPGRGGSARAGAEEPSEEEEAPTTPATVRFDQLDEHDQRRLIEYIVDVEDNSRFLTVKYLVERIGHSSVLPMLSEIQLKGLLLDMIARAMFEVSETKAISAQTGQPFIRKELALSVDHNEVAKWVEAE